LGRKGPRPRLVRFSEIGRRPKPTSLCMYLDSSRYGDLSVLVVTVVTVDARADVVGGGAALIGLYVIIAAIFWWG
jgi:Ca2+:H+ antiporter